MNDVIRAVASARQSPLVDLYAALDPLPSHGVSNDLVHPSVEPVDGGTWSADFTPSGLSYGFEVRNLTALQMLDRLRNLP